MNSAEVSLGIAFTAGFLTFFTPCFLPLLPAYLSFITGLSFSDLTSSSARSRKVVVLNTVFFIIGFSIVFILLGATVTWLSSVLHAYKEWIRIIGGVVIIIFGIILLGGFSVGFLNREKKVHLQKKPAGPLGSLLVGSAFAAGWSPCVGPILGSILVYAGAAETVGFGIWLLVCYSAGLALPFLITAFLVSTVLARMSHLTRYLKVARVVSGIVLIVMGILLITDPFHLLRQF